MSAAGDYVGDFMDTQVGQMFGTFARCFLVTLVGFWVQDGLPMYELDGGDVARWVEVALQAGVSLVLVNYFGPWEKRYGQGKSDRDDEA